ncbi:MAG: hypothetical protein VYE02_04035, partial [Verrucomicrobiota bacterium]|nr:hypothetical protein [Verrucomicrobiota bacterium]
MLGIVGCQGDKSSAEYDDDVAGSGAWDPPGGEWNSDGSTPLDTDTRNDEAGSAVDSGEDGTRDTGHVREDTASMGDEDSGVTGVVFGDSGHGADTAMPDRLDTGETDPEMDASEVDTSDDWIGIDT